MSHELRKELGGISSVQLKMSDELTRQRELLDKWQRTEGIFDAEQRQQLLSRLESAINRSVSDDFLKAVESTYGKDVLKATHYVYLRDQVKAIRHRMMDELKSLGRRGNLNLVLGILTAVAGLGVLADVVYGNHAIKLEGVDRLVYFLQRASLVLATEVFAFFFLKLYKLSLGEMKYFQNELTNIDVKAVAIEAAILHGDKSTISKIIQRLAETERNFVLKKGERTVELAKAELEHAVALEVTKNVSSSLQQIIKGQQT